MSNSILKVLLFIATILGVPTLMICIIFMTRVNTGDVAIVTTWGGKILPDVLTQGIYFPVLKHFDIIDTTMTRAETDDIQPKDANGVRLKDVNVIVTYRLDPTKVAQFYSVSKELDHEPDSDHNTLGLEILEKSVIPFAVQIATEKADLITVSSNLQDYANDIESIVNQKLNSLYPGVNPFQIISVTVPTFTLPDTIQKQVDAKAGYQAELETIAAQNTVVEQRKTLVANQAIVSANSLEQASKQTGLTPEQIINWTNAQAYADLASRTTSPTVLVNTGK
jgi:hypothetical protein